MAEFAYNSAKSESIGISPLKLTTEYYLDNPRNHFIILHALILQARYLRMCGKRFGNI